MLIPSFRSWPVAPVFLILSEPAKSTKWNLAEISSVNCAFSSPSGAASATPSSTSFTIFYSIVTVKTACDLELPSFISVALVCLWLIPLFNQCRHSAYDVTSNSFSPLTEMTFFSSLIVSSFNGLPVFLSLTMLAGSKRSCSSSLYSSKNAIRTLNSEYSDWALRTSSSSKMNLNTLGTIPTSSKGTPILHPVPIVCVFPDPVYPYANIVALYPWKHPKTKFRAHLLKICSYASKSQKTASKS